MQAGAPTPAEDRAWRKAGQWKTRLAIGGPNGWRLAANSYFKRRTPSGYRGLPPITAPSPNFARRHLFDGLLNRHTAEKTEERRRLEQHLEEQSPLRKGLADGPLTSGMGSVGSSSSAGALPPRLEPLVFKFSWRKLLRFAGPGWLMSLAYLDPGNLESDLQQGAYTGAAQVWVLWWSTVIGYVLQEGCARLGLATGRDLAQCVRSGYPRWVSLIVYVAMELAVTASDIQEVVGSAIALKLLFGLPLWAGCVVTAMDTLTFLLVHKLGVRYLEALITSLIALVAVCFFISAGNALSIAPDVGEAVRQVVEGWALPSLQPWGYTQAVATLGAVIMPHNLYLHSSLVLSRRTPSDGAQQLHEAISYSRIESAGALFFSFLINLAVVVTFWRYFYRVECAEMEGGPFVCVTVDSLAPGQQALGQCYARGAPPGQPATCTQIDLAFAGDALGKAVGHLAKFVWAVGLLAAGQAATMTATFAGQVLMDGMVTVNVAPWARVLFTRTLCMGPAIAIALSGAAEPAVFGPINMFLNVLQSVLLPFAMLPMLHFTTSAAVMGRFLASTTANVLMCAISLVVLCINLLTVAPLLTDDGPRRDLYRFLAVLYVGFSLRLVGSGLCALARTAADWVLAYTRDVLDAFGCADVQWPPRELRARLLPPQGSPFGGVPRSLTAGSFEGEVNFKL